MKTIDKFGIIVSLNAISMRNDKNGRAVKTHLTSAESVWIKECLSFHPSDWFRLEGEMKRERERIRETWPDQKNRARPLVPLPVEKTAGEAAASIAAVHCPHYRERAFGETRCRKVNPHCCGKLFGVSQNDSSVRMANS